MSTTDLKKNMNDVCDMLKYSSQSILNIFKDMEDSKLNYNNLIEYYCNDLHDKLLHSIDKRIEILELMIDSLDNKTEFSDVILNTIDTELIESVISSSHIEFLQKIYDRLPETKKTTISNILNKNYIDINSITKEETMFLIDNFGLGVFGTSIKDKSNDIIKALFPEQTISESESYEMTESKKQKLTIDAISKLYKDDDDDFTNILKNHTYSFEILIQEIPNILKRTSSSISMLMYDLLLNLNKSEICILYDTVPIEEKIKFIYYENIYHKVISDGEYMSISQYIDCIPKCKRYFKLFKEFNNSGFNKTYIEEAKLNIIQKIIFNLA